MPSLLVVQPDVQQADLLRNALRSHVSADVVFVESIQDAVAAIDRDIPDVVLLSTLIPAAEDYVIAYLGVLPGAGHAQVLLLPRLEIAEHTVQPRPPLQFRWWRQHVPTALTQPGHEPAMFTQDVVAYLARATALKKQNEWYGPHPGSLGRSERRRERRFLNHEVPWISVVRVGSDRADLIDVSSRGALLRTHTRPSHHFLRRPDPFAGRQPHIILELESAPPVHAAGRVVRCTPLTTGTRTAYAIAFAFDYSVGLHLPTTALVAAPDDDEDPDEWQSQRGSPFPMTRR